MIRRLLPITAACLSLFTCLPPILAQTPVTVPLGDVTLPPPPPVAITPVSVNLTVNVNGVPMQATLNLTGTVTMTQAGSNQYQLTLTPPSAPLALQPAGTHVEIPDPQPWLFVSGFNPVDPNDTLDQIRAGNRVLIYGRHFGDQDAGCRVQINSQDARIVSWLDTAVVAETPLLSARPCPALVLVWRAKDSYDLSMAPFKVVPAG